MNNYQFLESQIRYSKPGYSIRLVETAERLAGSKRRLYKATNKDLRVEMKNLKERTIYNMIEDVDHPEVTTADLLDILLFLENNLDNGTDETKIFAKALF